MRNDTVPVENYPLESIKPAGIRCMGRAAQNGLLGLSLQELTLLVEEAGQPGFRGRQLFEALYRRRVESAEQVSTLPLEYEDRIRMERDSRNDGVADATVVAVQYHEGRKAVAVKFSPELCDWVMQP